MNSDRLIFTLFFFCSLMLKAASHTSCLQFKYMGYQIQSYNLGQTELKFLISNIGKDTLYLMEDKIVIQIRNNGELAREKITNTYSGVPFFPPLMRKYDCEEEVRYNNKIDSLKEVFITKNLKKLEKNKVLTEGEIEYMKTKCIVLLPKDYFDYTYIFKSDNVNRNSLVEIKYFPDRQ